MAWVFELCACFGADGAAADAFRAAVVQSPAVVPRWTALWRNPLDGSAWVSVVPAGLSYGLNERPFVEDATQRNTLGLRCYELLRQAPRLSFALSGFEARDVIREAAPSEVEWERHGYRLPFDPLSDAAGLVLPLGWDEATGERFRAFDPTHVWCPPGPSHWQVGECGFQ